MNIKRLTTVAILSALSVVFIYLASIIPTGRLALIAVAGILPAAAVVAHGLRSGVYCFVVTAFLSLLIVPSKGSALVYTVIFGHYPVLKCLIEKLHNIPLEWLLKLLLFNTLLTVCILAFKSLFMTVMPSALSTTLLIYIAGNIAFAAYDLCFSGIITAYGRLIKKIMK